MRETIISSEKSYFSYIKELFDQKELFWFLAWKDLLLYYKQTIIGVIWVLLRPLLTVTVFTLIFSRVVGVSHQDTPYPLLVLSGMLVWQFFIDVFVHASNSFINNAHLISKVYFPRLFLPASRILCSLIDFGIVFLFYILLAAIRYQSYVSFVQLFYLPLCIIWLSIFSFFVSLLFATLMVKYRDFKHVIPFIGQLGLYATPVGFSVSIIPKKLQLLFFINPCTGIINLMRAILLNQDLHHQGVIVSLLVTVGILVVSFIYFKKSEIYLADVI